MRWHKAIALKSRIQELGLPVSGLGKVEFGVPEDYVQSAEPDDTIAIRPSDNAGVTLRFNLHYFEGEDVPADTGVQFVSESVCLEGRMRRDICRSFD